MQYELTHDTIARQVYEKASTEARTRRKVERYTYERYQAYLERGAKLTQDDLDYIQPYLASVNIDPEAAAFIVQAKDGLKRSNRRRRRLVMAVIMGLTALAVVALWQWRAALANQKMVLQQQGEIQTQADSLLLNGLELRRLLEIAEMAQDTAEMRRLEAEDARNRAELLAVLAEQQRQLADEQKVLAKQETQKAEKARLQALTNLERAEQETRRANEQELLAQNNAIDAHKAEVDALTLSVSSQLCAKALQEVDNDAKEALGMAYEACSTTNFDHYFAVTTLNNIFINPEYQFYRRRFEDTTSLAKIQCMAVSKDESLIALGGLDGTILLLEADKLRLLQTFKGHSSVIRSLDFSMNGDYLVSGASEGEVQVWNLKTNTQTAKLSLGSAANVVTFTEADQKIIAIGDAGLARSWRLDTREIDCLIKHNAIVLSIAKSPNQQLLATSDSNGSIKIWDAQGNRLIKKIRPGGKDYVALAFSHDNQQLALATEEGMISLLNCANWKVVQHWQASSEVNCLAFSADHQYLLVGQKLTNNTTGFSQHHGVTAWKLSDLQQAFTFGNEKRSIKSVRYLPKQNRFVYASYDGVIKQWDYALATRCPLLTSTARDIAHTAVSERGQWYAAAEPTTNGLQLWKSKPYLTRESVEMPPGLEQYWLEAIGFTKNENQLLAAASDGSVYRWSLTTRKIIEQFDIGNGDYERVCFSDNKQWLAAMDANDNRIHIWNVEQRREIAVLPGHQAPVNDLSFNNDATLLVSGHQDGELILWSIVEEKALTRVSESGKAVNTLALNTDNLLAVGRPKGVNVWRIEQDLTLQMYSGIPVAGAIESLSFSQNGNWLAVGSKGEQPAVSLWDSDKLRITQIYQMNEKNYPRSLSFTSTNGEGILIGGWDGSCRRLTNMIYALENRMGMKTQ